MEKEFAYAIELALLKQLRHNNLVSQYEFENILKEINKAYTIIQITIDND